MRTHKSQSPWRSWFQERGFTTCRPFDFPLILPTQQPRVRMRMARTKTWRTISRTSGWSIFWIRHRRKQPTTRLYQVIQPYYNCLFLNDSTRIFANNKYGHTKIINEWIIRLFISLLSEDAFRAWSEEWLCCAMLEVTPVFWLCFPTKKRTSKRTPTRTKYCLDLYVL